jgi:hypothetical protein
MYGVAAVPPFVWILTGWLAPDPHGHWSEHLALVGLKTTQLVLLFVLVMLLGWRALSMPLLMSFAVAGVGIVFQVLGDYQVADSIWRTIGDPGFGDGYNEGHDMAGSGDLLVLVGGLAFAIAAGIAGRVPVVLAIVAAAMVIIPPPFLWPAAGILVLSALRPHVTGQRHAGDGRHPGGQRKTGNRDPSRCAFNLRPK